MHRAHPLADDLDHVLAHTDALWDTLRGSRLFVTGGSGFFGTWLLESLLWANDRLGLGVRVEVLTRNPEQFMVKVPHLAEHSAVSLVCGDQVEFVAPGGAFDVLVHAAVEYGTPRATFERNVLGTSRLLTFAEQAGVTRSLFTSSGAVYGAQPRDVERLSEDFAGAPALTDPASAYGLAKRSSEHLAALYPSVGMRIARGFAFVGPYMPLDRTGAMGNFLADALGGGPIRVGGDGTPLRTYLYAADLAIWLWTILLRGEAGRPYNVGGAAILSVREVAERVASEVNPDASVQIAIPAERGLPARYVPDVDRARNELGLESWIGVDEAIRRTAQYLRSNSHPVSA